MYLQLPYRCSIREVLAILTLMLQNHLFGAIFV